MEEAEVELEEISVEAVLVGRPDELIAEDLEELEELEELAAMEVDELLVE